jgi:hypothetical protein
MDQKYLKKKYEQLKPHITKALTNAAQGYVFGCMVGVFCPSHTPSLKSIHSSGKSFAKVSAIYSVAESAIESYSGRKDYLNSFISGAVAGGLGVNDRSRRSILLGAGSFGFYSGINSYFCTGKE